MRGFQWMHPPKVARRPPLMHKGIYGDRKSQNSNVISHGRIQKNGSQTSKYLDKKTFSGQVFFFRYFFSGSLHTEPQFRCDWMSRVCIKPTGSMYVWQFTYIYHHFTIKNHGSCGKHKMQVDMSYTDSVWDFPTP